MLRFKQPDALTCC